MRPTNPLITIYPAIPPGIGEVVHARKKNRGVVRTVATLLVLIALGAALIASLGSSIV